jgi:hypothetical protein
MKGFLFLNLLVITDAQSWTLPIIKLKSFVQ